MRLIVDAVDPAAYTLVITPDMLGVPADLTSVTDASIECLRPDGTFVTWDPDLGAQTKASLTITYPYVAGDLPIAGRYRPQVTLTASTGPILVATPVFDVFDSFS